MPTYFDDFATIEKNQQVSVNIDATLVAIFRIKWYTYIENSLAKRLILTLNALLYIVIPDTFLHGSFFLYEVIAEMFLYNA